VGGVVRRDSAFWVNATIAVAVVTVVASAVFFWACPKGAYSRCNFARVQPGATLAEVEALLGPGQRIVPAVIPGTPTGPAVVGQWYYRWRQPGGPNWIVVAFDWDYRACDKQMFGPDP
jgi:hypothetical protein